MIGNEKTCMNCKYFDVCGDVTRTEPCAGKVSVSGKMTYKHFLLAGKKRDSKDQYRSYLGRFDEAYKIMSGPMQKQYAEMNFKYRFINHAWA